MLGRLTLFTTSWNRVCGVSSSALRSYSGGRRSWWAVASRYNCNLNGPYSNLKLNCWVATTSFTGCEMHLYCLIAAITDS